MPRADVPVEIARATICKKGWPAHVVVMCSDRIPQGEVSKMLLTVTWPAAESTAELGFGRATGSAKGEVVFGSAVGPATNTLAGNHSDLVDIYGKVASTPGSREPDVALTVTLGEVSRSPVHLSVGDVAIALAVHAEDGVAPPPVSLTPDVATRLKAAVVPATAGSFVWATTDATAIEIIDDKHDGLVEVKGHTPLVPDRKLCVLFTPQDGSPAVMAVHTLSVGVRYFGQIEDRSVAPEYAEAATGHRFLPAGTPFSIVDGGGNTVSSGVTKADGRFDVMLPAGAPYELKVPDFEGLGP
ncbi:MAG: hypothetical protein HY330_01590 [Chloroflexi bacterium]|nr:hypothetical protein [Chloroflexota bacterium]